MRGPHSHILIETLPYLDQRRECDVIGNAGRVTDRAKKDSIEMSQLVEKVVRHNATVLLVVLSAPGNVGGGQLEGPIPLSRRLQHAQGRRQNLQTNPVSGIDGDL